VLIFCYRPVKPRTIFLLVTGLLVLLAIFVVILLTTYAESGKTGAETIIATPVSQKKILPTMVSVSANASEPSSSNVTMPTAPVVQATASVDKASSEDLALPMRFAKVPSSAVDLESADILHFLHGRIASIKLRQPIAQYTLGFREGLKLAQLRDFFFIADSSGQLVAAGDIVGPDESGSFRTRSTAPDPPYGGATAIAAAIEHLAAIPQVRAGSYEVRTLSIPCPPIVYSSYFDVIWLKSDSGQPDLIYQLASSNSKIALPYHLEAGRLYLADDFEKIILNAPTK